VLRAGSIVHASNYSCNRISYDREVHAMTRIGAALRGMSPTPTDSYRIRCALCGPTVHALRIWGLSVDVLRLTPTMHEARSQATEQPAHDTKETVATDHAGIWTIVVPLISVGSIWPRCHISPRARIGEAAAARAGLQAVWQSRHSRRHTKRGQSQGARR